MRLSRANIKNFRSIRDISLTFEPRCKVLVGINESGKSNILKALSLLGGEDPSPSDVRECGPNEDPKEEAFVRFVFAHNNDDRGAVLRSAEARLVIEHRATPLVTWKGSPVALAGMLDRHTESLYTIHLRPLKRHFQTWSAATDGFKIVPGWLKPLPSCPPGATVLCKGVERPLAKAKLIHAASFPGQLPTSHLAPATLEDATELVVDEINAYTEEQVPDCVFWRYSEDLLLPASLNLDQFALNPDVCVPLQNMFALSGYPDVSTAVATAKAVGPNGVRNLLNRVAVRSTRHIRSVWKDYKDIAIGLAQNGPNIDAHVQDRHNVYDMARRSDGFKRFVAFLIMVSAQVKTKDLVNTLYLQDEPDTGLHPSGARYLRDELISIAKANHVVFSTHSIFMIDRERIERHIIVTKRAEVTEVQEANSSNVADEEVLYNALGYSLFETLKEYNIIFEGWRDKRLFQVAMRSLPVGLKSVFKNVGLCHAKGVRDIGRITPMLELARRKWLIVSDGDAPAVQQQRAYDGAGPWYRYDELLGKGVKAITGEDFIAAVAFRAPVDALRSHNPALPPLDDPSLEGTEPRIAILNAWLKAGGMSQADAKTAIESVKEQVFTNLHAAQIVGAYSDMLKILAGKLKSL